ncbi:hypothetical protein Tco_1087768 [Tanacetum coccineum]
MNVDHSISKAFMLIKPNNLDDFMDNDADDVLDDVCEDEWLQDALRKVSRLSQSVGQLMTYPPLRLEGLLFELERNLLPNIPRNLRKVSRITPALHLSSVSICVVTEYFIEEYDEEREMEPRPVRVRETTLVLRTRSPRARRQKERVVEFEDTLNRDGSRVERNYKGGRPSEHRVDDNKSQGMNLPPLLAAHLGRSENGQHLQSYLASAYDGHQPSTNIGGNPPPNDTHLSHNAQPFIPNSL